MRRRSAFATAILVGTLILTTAVPARAALRIHLYKGQTSQAHYIAFFVARTESGRFVREMRSNLTFTCEDQTTQRVGISYGFARTQVPLTDGAFSIDEVDQGAALHVAGYLGLRLGSGHGQGTLRLTFPALTAEEQAQLCTTGDLTWEVDYVRFIWGTRLDAPAGLVERTA